MNFFKINIFHYIWKAWFNISSLNWKEFVNWYILFYKVFKTKKIEGINKIEIKAIKNKVKQDI